VNVDEMVKGVHDALAVRRVYGEPIERNGVVVVPAAVVRGGGGGGSDERSNGGGGFGLQARPVGAFVIRGDRVRFEPAVDVTRIVAASLAAFVMVAYLWRPRRRA
jgi:uncharacterized spore protein YtfJ